MQHRRIGSVTVSARVGDSSIGREGGSFSLGFTEPKAVVMQIAPDGGTRDVAEDRPLGTPGGMQAIDVRAMSPHEYAVVVTEGQDVTHHKVRVTEGLLDDLGIVDLDEEDLVRESFRFLLEREPADSILREFDLAVISRYFGEYLSEMRSRLAG